MGFLMALGKMALEDYVSKKGIDGVIQDASNFFNDVRDGYNERTNEIRQNDAQKIWEQMINCINEHLEKGNFPQAEQKLNDYYQEYEDSKDYYYYYWESYVLLRWLQTIDSGAPMWNKMTSKADEAIKAAIRMASNSDQSKEAEDWKNWLDELLERENYGQEWNSVTNAIASLVEDKRDYEGALRKLDQFYEDHNEEYDKYYFAIRTRIYLNWLENEQENAYEDHISEATQGLERLKADIQDADERKEYNEFKERLDKIGKTHSEIVSSRCNATKAEQEYLEEFKACLANDGEISNGERRLLNKLRDRLGLSQEQAERLEAMCNPNQLTEEEKEYIEEYRTCCVDGNVSEKERRLLNKLCKMYNITPERAKDLEKM